MTQLTSAFDVQALFRREEVWVIAQAQDTAMIKHWIKSQQLRPTMVADRRLFDRSAVEALLRHKFGSQPGKLLSVRRDLVRLAMGELTVQAGAPTESTGRFTATASGWSARGRST